MGGRCWGKGASGKESRTHRARGQSKHTLEWGHQIAHIGVSPEHLGNVVGRHNGTDRGQAKERVTVTRLIPATGHASNIFLLKDKTIQIPALFHFSIFKDQATK